MKSRRGLLIFVLALNALIFISSEINAAEETNISSKAAAAIISTEGAVLSLDLDAQTPILRLDQDGRQSMIYVNKSTPVWKDGVSVGLETVKPSQKVRVRHRTKGGKEVAKSIEVVS